MSAADDIVRGINTFGDTVDAIGIVIDRLIAQRAELLTLAHEAVDMMASVDHEAAREWARLAAIQLSRMEHGVVCRPM